MLTFLFASENIRGCRDDRGLGCKGGLAADEERCSQTQVLGGNRRCNQATVTTCRVEIVDSENADEFSCPTRTPADFCRLSMRLACRLRCASRDLVIAQQLARTYSQHATASALKASWHVGKDATMTPTGGDKRPMKVPKLVADQSPSTPLRHDSDKSKVFSPPFTIPPSKSTSHPAPVPSGSSQKSGRRQGKSRSSLLRSRYDSLPEFEGPMHDAVYIEAQHRAAIGSRPEIKPALADNPKSPVMNFVVAHLGSNHSLQFESKEYFDSGTNRPVFR